MYTEQAVCGRLIAFSFETEQWLCVCSVCSCSCLRKYTWAVSYLAVVVVLITSFHCWHFSVVLNLGPCLLMQRLEWVTVCVCDEWDWLMQPLVISSHTVYVYLNVLMLWFTGAFMEIIFPSYVFLLLPAHCFSTFCLSRLTTSIRWECQALKQQGNSEGRNRDNTQISTLLSIKRQLPLPEAEAKVEVP